MADPYFVPTRSSRLLKQTSHEVIVHEEPKRIQSDQTEKPRRRPNNQDFDELDMKQARFDVYKFAQSGLNNLEKQKNQKQLALKLGAVPYKKKSVNYQTLKKQLSLKRTKEKEQAELAHLGFVHRPKRGFKTDSRNPKAKLNKKKSMGTAILKTYGTVKMKKGKK